jgi:uncharacterized cupredoxin-like copper-binding protein
MKNHLLLPALLALGLAVPTVSANAAMTVKVDLWDKGAGTEMPTNLAYPLTDAQHGQATMGITLSSESIKPGIVSFQVTNDSKDTIHELILAKITNPGQPLPYDTGKNVVFEDKIAYLGEVEETDPGKTGTLTKALTPGEYMLLCNVAGHYEAGMWTVFNVAR